MKSSYRDKAWSIHFSGATSTLVGFLGWKNGYLLEDLLIHIIVVFGLMFILIELSLFFFDRFEIWSLFSNLNQVEKPKEFKLKLVQNQDNQFRETDEINQEVKKIEFTGQVEPSLSMGLPDDQARKELKERMGLNN